MRALFDTNVLEEAIDNAAVSGRPKGESVLTAWFPARAERGQQAVATYRRIPYRAKRGRERLSSAARCFLRVRWNDLLGGQVLITSVDLWFINFLVRYPN